MNIVNSLTTVNFNAGGMTAIKGIVLHSQSGFQNGTISWFKNPASGASAHFCISAVGEIVRVVNEEKLDRAWHAGIFDAGKCPEWALPGESFEVTENRKLRQENNSMKQTILNQAAEVKMLQGRIAKLRDDVAASNRRMEDLVKEQERIVKMSPKETVEMAERKLKRMKAIAEIVSSYSLPDYQYRLKSKNPVPTELIGS